MTYVVPCLIRSLQGVGRHRLRHSIWRLCKASAIDARHDTAPHDTVQQHGVQNRLPTLMPTKQEGKKGDSCNDARWQEMWPHLASILGSCQHLDGFNDNEASNDGISGSNGMNDVSSHTLQRGMITLTYNHSKIPCRGIFRS